MVTRQTIVVFLLSVRSLPQRISSTIVAVVGFAMVSSVIVGVVGLAAGMSVLWKRNGADNIAIAMSRGAFSETNSRLPIQSIDALSQAPGLDQYRRNVISPELAITTNLVRKSDNKLISVFIRGFSNLPIEQEDHFRIKTGRMFQSGVDEVIVGGRLINTMKDISVGSSLRIANRVFKIVGAFDTGQNIHESEVWGDSSSLANAVGMSGQVSTIVLKLKSASDFDSVSRFVTSSPDLDVDILRESDYFQQQESRLNNVILIPGVLLIGIMAFAATLAAVNTMQSSIQSRLDELATLRAIGFDATSVMAGLVLQSAVLGCLGGVIGSCAAYLLFNNTSIVTSNGISAMAFSMKVQPILLCGAILCVICFSVLGGIWPALSVARTNVAGALRRI